MGVSARGRFHHTRSDLPSGCKVRGHGRPLVLLIHLSLLQLLLLG